MTGAACATSSLVEDDALTTFAEDGKDEMGVSSSESSITMYFGGSCDVIPSMVFLSAFFLFVSSSSSYNHLSSLNLFSLASQATE